MEGKRWRAGGGGEEEGKDRPRHPAVGALFVAAGVGVGQVMSWDSGAVCLLPPLSWLSSMSILFCCLIKMTADT